jgi:N-acetylglutamate synthase-like GNAT family acetyltransferase
MEDWLIRVYQEKDLEDCRSLWAELTQHHRELYNDPSIGGAQPGLFFDRHLKQAGANHIWVAERDGRVIGLVGLLFSGLEAEVEPIIVLRDCRGAGVGQSLLAQAVAAARQAGVHYLNVRPVSRNLEAILFFFREGFELLGRPELFMDLQAPESGRWKPGPEVLGCSFKI